MNKLVQELIRPFLGEVESKYDLVVYGGGFKPPTKGHFEVVEKTLRDHPEITKFYIKKICSIVRLSTTCFFIFEQ